MESARIIGRHRREFELFGAFARECEANQAASVVRHKVDILSRDVFGKHAQIAFIFAIFVIDEDDHLAL